MKVTMEAQRACEALSKFAVRSRALISGRCRAPRCFGQAPTDSRRQAVSSLLAAVAHLHSMLSRCMSIHYAEGRCQDVRLNKIYLRVRPRLYCLNYVNISVYRRWNVSEPHLLLLLILPQEHAQTLNLLLASDGTT